MPHWINQSGREDQRGGTLRGRTTTQPRARMSRSGTENDPVFLAWVREAITGQLEKHGQRIPSSCVRFQPRASRARNVRYRRIEFPRREYRDCRSLDQPGKRTEQLAPTTQAAAARIYGRKLSNPES